MQTSLFRRDMMEILPMESINGRFLGFHSWTQLPTPHQSKQQIFLVNLKNNKSDLSLLCSLSSTANNHAIYVTRSHEGRRCHVTIKRSRHCASWRMHFATISFLEMDWRSFVLCCVVCCFNFCQFSSCWSFLKPWKMLKRQLGSKWPPAKCCWNRKIAFELEEFTNAISVHRET